MAKGLEAGAERRFDERARAGMSGREPDIEGFDEAECEPESLRRGLLAPGGKVSGEAVRAIADAAEDDAESEAQRTVRFRLSRDLNKRLDVYLTDRIPYISRAQAQRLIESEKVRVNGRPPKASTKVRQGDVVEAVAPAPISKEITPEEIPLDVLFEDEHLIVINKTPDIIVHPARSNLSGTMVNALAHHFLSRGGEASLSSVGRERARPGVVHRLDRRTSGVLVFAKNDEAHWRLGKQFEKRQVEKRYLCVVEGTPEPLADLIDLPIGPHPSNQKGLREKYVVRHDDLGKPSRTVYRVRERYEGYALVEIELLTGRTHQIRVHMSHEGHPLVGDDMYGGRPLTYADLGEPTPGGHDPDLDRIGSPDLMARQALHAAKLGFRHPISGEEMVFTAAVPLDMARLIGILRRRRPGAGPTEFEHVTLDLSKAVPDAGVES
jgi:23S rRNA pseudouridine1911/1915/1917 synthase